MLIKALESSIIRRHEQLNSFLSEDQDPVGKLGAYGPCELDILDFVGKGNEGLVVECRNPRSEDSFVLKLFFQNQEPADQTFWPLKAEARYYASCAAKKSYFSNSSHPRPLLPGLPFTKWLRSDKGQDQSDKRLFNTIAEDMSTDQSVARLCNDTVSILGDMCAGGWVAFHARVLQRVLRRISSHQKIHHVGQFTGTVIIGIIKPFFTGKVSCEKRFERQIHIMLLMREFKWRLIEFHPRNWVDGYLVDGGDVDCFPLHIGYLERSWASAFFKLVKEQQTAVQSTSVKDEQ